MSLPLDLSGDAEVFDGLQLVTVELPDAAGSFSALALKRPLTLREIELSAGSLLPGDVRWHFSAADLPATPIVETLITEADGRVWTVIIAAAAVFGGRRTCTARVVEDS